MKPQPNPKSEPLRDVFAAQGILVVLAGILIAVLQLAAPEFCGELLRTWHDAAERSPELTALAEKAAAWFASIFSA